ncbi:MAG: hypothetical protein WC654_00720 [Patescibacteria group bacterium]
MPKYRNDTASAITAGGAGTVQPGAAIVVSDYLSDDGGLTLIEEKASPLDKLHAAAIGDGIALTGLEVYSELVFMNNSGAIASIVLNGDTANPVVLLNGAVWTRSNDREISTADITGEGTSGYLYVSGEV